MFLTPLCLILVTTGMAKRQEKVILEDSDSDCIVLDKSPSPKKVQVVEEKRQRVLRKETGETPREVQESVIKIRERLITLASDSKHSGGVTSLKHKHSQQEDTEKKPKSRRNLFDAVKPSSASVSSQKSASSTKPSLVNLRKALKDNPELLAAVEGATSNVEDEILSKEDLVLIRKLALLPLHVIQLEQLTEENQQIFLQFAVSNLFLRNPDLLKKQFNIFLNDALAVIYSVFIMKCLEKILQCVTPTFFISELRER